ncbi:MAG: HAD family phosphatase, partial [Fulvivirga sp.]|nr:HAD family phosphatase [Fulvivirga sp.]
MTRNNQQIEALIFDLGGVLINLNVQHTLEAFSRLSAKKHEEIVALYQQHNLFHSYEKGLISDEDFREGVRDLLQIQAEDHTLDDAWNAMIKDFPQGRLEVLRKLGEDYRLFLLSNTNNIHLKCVRKVFEPIKQETLEDYFEEAY